MKKFFQQFRFYIIASDVAQTESLKKFFKDYEMAYEEMLLEKKSSIKRDKDIVSE